MESADWAVIVVAMISVLSAWLAGRAAQRAARYNSDASVMNARTTAETEAYHRARKMDVETIERQDREIDEIRQNNKELRDKVREVIAANNRLSEENQALREDNETLRRRLTRLEELPGGPRG